MSLFSPNGFHRAFLPVQTGTFLVKQKSKHWTLFQYRFISLLFSRAKKVGPKKPALWIIHLPMVASCQKFEKLRSLKTGNVKHFQICFSISAHGSQANETRRIFRLYLCYHFFKKVRIQSPPPMKNNPLPEYPRPCVQRFFNFWIGTRV